MAKGTRTLVTPRPGLEDGFLYRGLKKEKVCTLSIDCVKAYYASIEKRPRKLFCSQKSFDALQKQERAFYMFEDVS